MMNNASSIATMKWIDRGEPWRQNGFRFRPGDRLGDTNTANNQRNEATTLTTAGDLRLLKSATPDPVVGGAEVTYTLTVFNDGPSASTNFRVVDTLPAAATYVASSFNGAGWTFNSGTMTATHAGTLAVGSSSSFTFRARVNAGSGNIINAAMVEAIGTPDADPSNNDADVTTSITPGADLALSKSAAPAPAIAGQSVTFTLTARNLGPSVAQKELPPPTDNPAEQPTGVPEH